MKESLDKLIIVRDITRYFVDSRNRKNENLVLKGINLEIGHGEIVIINGISGSGKSTLLNLMAGLDHPNSGEIIFNINGEGTKKITNFSRAELEDYRRYHSSFIPQYPRLIPSLTAFENVQLTASLMNLEDTEKKVIKTLDGLHLTRLKDRFIQDLSLTEKKMISIARALVKETPLYFADELFANLDSLQSKIIVKNLIGFCRAYGISFVLTSNYQEIPQNELMRSFKLENGKIMLLT